MVLGHINESQQCTDRSAGCPYTHGKTIEVSLLPFLLAAKSELCIMPSADVRIMQFADVRRF